MFSDSLGLGGVTGSMDYAFPRLVRTGVFLAVLASSFFLVPHLTTARVLVLLVAAAGACLFGAWFRWPEGGPIVVIVSCLIVPLTIGTGTDSTINAGMVTLVGALGLWIVDMFRREESRIRRSRLIAALGLFLIAALISFLFGNQPQAPFAETAPLRAQVGELVIFVLSFTAFLLAGHQLRTRTWLKATVTAFLFLGFLFSTLRFVHLDAVASRLFQGGSDGSVFYIWLVGLAFGQALYNDRLHRLIRLGLGAGLVATLAWNFTWMRDWNSGWVPPLVALLVALWSGSRRLALPSSVIGAGFAFANVGAISAYLQQNKQYDILTREAAWTTLINVIKINPIIGTGPANYYWYTPMFSILGYNVKFNSHENYVDLIAQLGFVGLVCFLWVVFEILLLGLRVRQKARDSFDLAFVHGALGALAGMLASGFLGDWFLPFVYNVGFRGLRASLIGWLFLGGLLALDRIHTAEERTRRTDQAC